MSLLQLEHSPKTRREMNMNYFIDVKLEFAVQFDVSKDAGCV